MNYFELYETFSIYLMYYRIMVIIITIIIMIIFIILNRRPNISNLITTIHISVEITNTNNIHISFSYKVFTQHPNVFLNLLLLCNS